MARLYNTFEFVGNISIPKASDKFHEVKTSVGGWEGHRLNFAVQESKTNSVYVEVYGGFSQSKPNKVFSFGKGTENEKGAKLEIPWSDRLKPETIDMVADFKKFVVDLETDQKVKEEVGKLRYEIRNIEYKDTKTADEVKKLSELKSELAEKAVHRKEFIHDYDAIIYLASVLEDYKDHKFRLTGSIEMTEWKGKFYRKFKPNFIEIVPSDSVNKLRATYDIFFTKDALDEKDFKEEKKIYVEGYVIDYDGKAKKDAFFPQQFVINASKLDFNNELHVKRFEALKSTFNVKGKGVFHCPWEVNIFRGADAVEFTINDLSQKQREYVELGLNKLEDFAPKGGMLGETVEENRLIKPILRKFDNNNDFSEGAAESTFEVDDLIYVTTQDEKYEDVVKEEPKQDDIKLDDLDDLFS